MELRSLATPPAADGRKLSGYAAVFNSPSEIIAERGKLFREVLVPGAFARSLGSPPRGSIVALWNHGKDNRPPLASTPGTLKLWEDARGLAFEFEAPASAADVVEAVHRGDVRAMSFGFVGGKDRWSTRDGMPFREVSDLDLLEISLVVHPAYAATSVAARDRSELSVPDLGLPLATARARLALADRE